MKTFKTFAKKPLAVLLAVIMVVGSISVIAMAVDEPTGNAEFIANFKVYDEDSESYSIDDSANGIEYAGPGDKVKVELRLATDFTVCDMGFIFKFDKDVFDYAWSYNGWEDDFEDYFEEVDDGTYNVPDLNSNYNRSQSFMYEEATHFENIESTGVSASEFTNMGGIYFILMKKSQDRYRHQYGTFTPVEGQSVPTFSDHELICSTYLIVKQDVQLSDVGEFILVEPATKTLSKGGANTYLYNEMTLYDADRNEEWAAATYNFNLTGVSEALMFGGSIRAYTINGYGYYPGATQDDPRETERDFYAEYGATYAEAKEADPNNAIPDPTPVSDDYTFLGWSTELPTITDGSTAAPTDENGRPVYGGDYSKMLTEAQLNEIKYLGFDSEEVPVSKLYAVYTAADTSYTVNVKDPQGDDYADGSKSGIAGYIGEQIAITADALPDGVSLPEGTEIDAISPATLTLGADETANVITITTKVKTFTVTWKENADDTDSLKEITVDYGTDLTDTNNQDYADPDLKYLDKTSDNFGTYVSKWTDHPTSVTSNVVLTPAEYSPLPVKVIYDNKDRAGHVGKFDTNGENPLESSVNYGTAISAAFTDTLKAPEGYMFASNGAEYLEPDATDYTAVANLSSLPANVNKDNYEIVVDNDTLTVNIYPVFEIMDGNVVFNANGGKFDTSVSSDPDALSYDLNYGDTYTIPDADDFSQKKTDDNGASYYDFIGWNTDQNATEAISVSGTFKPETDDATETYYAVWKDNRITVTFVGKGGNTDVVKTFKRNLVDGKYTLTDDDMPAADAVQTDEGETWVWDIDNNELTSNTTIAGHSVYDVKYSWTDASGNAQNANDGPRPASDEFTALAAPEFDSTKYEFKGWYKDSIREGDPDYAPGAPITMPAEALNLVGQIVPQTFKITYKVSGAGYNSADTYAEENYAYNDDVTPYAEPAAIDGYTWSGWSDIPEKLPNYAVTVTGTFTPKQYSIVYVDPDGHLVKAITQDYDTPISEGAPDIDNNWHTPALTYTGWDYELPEKMPLFADTDTFEVDGVTYTGVKVSPVSRPNEKVTVYFEHIDGEKDSLEDYPGSPLNESDIPAFRGTDIKDGYDVAWDQTLTVFPDTETTIKAVQTPKKVNVTIDTGDSSTTTSTQVDYNAKIDKPSDPTNPNYPDFEGWYLPDGTPFDFDQPIDQIGSYTEDLTITAVYSITDTYYQATGVDTATGEFTYTADKTFKNYSNKTDDDSYTAPTVDDILKMEGFTAKFWSLDKSTEIVPDGNFAATSREFYPVYEINKHTVTYVNEGADYKVFTDVPFAGDVPRPDADPTSADPELVFAGWKDAKGNAPGDYASMPDEDLTFTAQYVVPGADYTITYYDREGNVYKTFVVHSGDPITDEYIPDDPTRFGFVFKGWDPEIPDVMPEENLEFNAKWEIDPKFVALVIGGVVVSGAVVGGVAAANTALITGAVIAGGALVIGGIVLAEHTYKVTYIVDGEVYRTFYIVEGTKIIVPKDPTKDGATFEGWTPEIPEKMPANDLTFSATWSTDKADDGAAPVDSLIPDTGSATAGLAAFAVISSAAAAAYVITRRKKED